MSEEARKAAFKKWYILERVTAHGYEQSAADFNAGWYAHAVESVLECVVCGERSFVISPINDSDGFCFAEQKIYSITWPTLADPDGNIAEAGCDYCEHCHNMNQKCGKCGREWSGDIQRKEYP